MRIDLLTREYPPEIYGGAGVHVAELVRALRSDVEVQVRCFGAPRGEPDTQAYRVPPGLESANGTLKALGVDLEMAEDVAGADLVHSHTWYANAAGHLARLLHGIPHVVTAHSLEPMRPWKAEQLGGGYRVSSWVERAAFESADAVIAVSEGMRRDIERSYPGVDGDRLHVVRNGIDAERWRAGTDAGVLESLGVDPDRPSVVFVGRITRQKGLPYLLRAAHRFPSDVQLVLCAGAPDTEEILEEVASGVRELQEERTGVVWLRRLLDHRELTTVLGAAAVFVCPSIYEPLGIVNLEAMACGAPVVATATGGIPEVVDDGVTGLLVTIDQAGDGTGSPRDPERFATGLADAVTQLVGDPARARELGRAGRERVEREFTWERIASQTREVYATVLR